MDEWLFGVILLRRMEYPISRIGAHRGVFLRVRTHTRHMLYITWQD